jgi:hypothetical protein
VGKNFGARGVAQSALHARGEKPFTVRRRAAVGLLAAMVASAAGLPGLADAAGEAPLLFSGFAFTGNFENRAQRYPLSAAIAGEDAESLNALLRARLQQRPALASRVKLGLADDNVDATAVAFALVQEEVETQRIDGKFWVIVTLQANVLAFNKASRIIVASYPVRMQVTVEHAAAPSEDEKRELVRAAYTSTDPSSNIFDQWLARLETVRVREGARKYLRVTEVSLAPEAERIIAAAGRSPVVVSSEVANYLEAAVAEQAGISIVPNSIGEAIGKTMLYRFANGANLQLTLPEADYALTFRVRDFVSRTLEKPEYLQDIFRVKGSVAIAIVEPDAKRIVMEEDVYDTRIVTRPRRADVQLTQWDQYAKTLERLVFSTGKQMVKVDDNWLKDNASRGLGARQGFQSAGQVLKELM